MPTQGLLLDEELLKGVPEDRRCQILIKWIQSLEEAISLNELGNTPLEKICDQVYSQLLITPSRVARTVTSQCLAKLLEKGNPITLLNILNRCNDILRQDNPTLSSNQLAALDCLTSIYSTLRTTFGRCHEETISLICKLLKTNDPVQRCNLLNALKTVVDSVPVDSIPLGKEVVKTAKLVSKDANVDVKSCLFLSLQGFVLKCPIQDSEVETLFSLCLRTCSDSSVAVREAVGQLLGVLCALLHKDFINATKTKSDPQKKKLTTEQTLLPLRTTFSKGLYGFIRGTTDKLMGGGSAKKDLRAAIAKAYVTFAVTLGAKWLEDNVEPFIKEVLLLTHIDANDDDGSNVRQNVTSILQSTIGNTLTRTAQILAAKELLKRIATLKTTMDRETQPGLDANGSKVAMVCCLDIISFLLLNNDTLVTRLIDDSSTSVMDLFFSLLTNPAPSVRMAASSCIQSVAKIYPLQLSKLVDKVIVYLNGSSRTGDGISGYSSALAALLSSVRDSPFGISKTRVKIIFNFAEELLRTAHQHSNTVTLIRSGWLIIGALISVGPTPIQNEIPRVFHLWRNVFGSKESEDQKKGKTETPGAALVALYGKVGALSSMHSFVCSCELGNRPELSKKFASIFELAISTVISTEIPAASAGKAAENQLFLLKTKLYDVSFMLEQKLSKGFPVTLLKSLLADIVTSRGYHTQNNSILKAYCEEASRPLFEEYSRGYTVSEVRAESNQISSSVEFEQDEHQLYLRPSERCGQVLLNVRLVDSAIRFYSKIPKLVSPKHVSDSIAYFQEVLNDNKHKVDEYTYANIITSILLLTRTLEENGISVSYDATAKTIVSVMLGGVVSTSVYVRIASLSAIASLVTSCREPKLPGEIVETCLERMKTKTDFPAGFALAACFALKSSKVSPGSAQLSSVISLLLKLAQDLSSHSQQKWAVFGLFMLADALGPSFRAYVDTSVSLCSKLVLCSSFVSDETIVFAGKLLTASIMILGPELDSTGSALTPFLNICHVLRSQDAPWLQCAALDCLQKLHLFNRPAVNLPKTLPIVLTALLSSNLELRKVSLLFLKQLVQRDPRMVYDLSSNCISKFDVENLRVALFYRMRSIPSTEESLGSLLFKLIDVERNSEISASIRSTMLVIFASSDIFTDCLQLCREVVTASQELPKADETNDLTTVDSPDDEERYKPSEESAAVTYTSYSSSTKIFAVQCVQNVLLMLSEGARASLSILGDVIRVAFIAALSPADSLRLEGLRALQILIDRFSAVEDPAYEGHSVLEQYQAQIAAALRPSFETDASPDVGIVACNVLSSWMRGGGASDEYQIQRSYGLLKSGYNRLVCSCNEKEVQSCTHKAFSEAVTGKQKLAVLKAWAELYIHFTGKEGPVSLFLQQDQGLLSSLWITALTDHARSILPSELKSHVQEVGFYSDESEFSRTAWTVMLQSTSLWLVTDKKALESIANKTDQARLNPEIAVLQSLTSLALEHLCNCKASEAATSVISCLTALKELSTFCDTRSALLLELMSPESLHTIHRIVLTKPQLQVHKLVVELLLGLVVAASKLGSENLISHHSSTQSARRSTHFSVLEICYSLLVRHLGNSSMLIRRETVCSPPFSSPCGDVEKIVCGVLTIFEALPTIIPDAEISLVLPTVLHATYVVFYQAAFRPRASTICQAESNAVTRAGIKLLRELISANCSNAVESELKEGVVNTVITILEKVEGSQNSEWSFDPITRMMLVALICKCNVKASRARQVLEATCRQASAGLETISAAEKPKVLQILHSVLQTCSPGLLPMFAKSTSGAIFQIFSKVNQKSAYTREEIKVYRECVHCIERLVERAEHHRRTLVLNILVTALLNFSLTGNADLKEFAKSKIQSVVASYPDNAKQLLQNPELRQRAHVLLL